MKALLGGFIGELTGILTLPRDVLVTSIGGLKDKLFDAALALVTQIETGVTDTVGNVQGQVEDLILRIALQPLRDLVDGIRSLLVDSLIPLLQIPEDLVHQLIFEDVTPLLMAIPNGIRDIADTVLAILKEKVRRATRPGRREKGRGPGGGWIGGWRRLPKRLGAVTVGYKCH